MGVNKGIGAIDSLTQENDGGNSAEITPLKSGSTLKVAAKSASDIASYYGYSIFKKVYTFVPKNPSVRNAKGFVESNPTPWDQASQYYFDLAQKADDKKSEELKAEGRLYKGKQRFLLGFHNLETGEDIVVDLTKVQAQGVYATIKKYEKKIGKLAFELSKTGESTSTTVSLSPIIDMDEDLTEQERKNFEAAVGKEFNGELFDNVLYEADEAEQVELLKQAGFDVALIGYSAEAGENGAQEEVGSTKVDSSDLPF